MGGMPVALDKAAVQSDGDGDGDGGDNDGDGVC